MKTKQLVSATVAAFLLATPSAFAENNKHNFILDIANIDVDQEFGNVTYLGNDSSIFVGLGYAYQIDISDSLFVKPKVIFYLSDMDINDTDGTSDKSNLSSMSSYLVDVGYNQNKFSYYGTVGVTSATYERTVSNSVSSASDAALTYGFGIGYNINDKTAIDLGYQATDLEYNSISGAMYDISLSNVKLGFAYKF
jgi:opacity protein-like surface antigen